MSCASFMSVQAATLEAFVALKHAQGYRYTHQSSLLRRFDRFLVAHCYECLWLDKQIVDEYLAQISHAGAYSQSTMLSPIRDYSAYLHLRYAESYVLRMLPFRPRRPSRFHLYTPEQISDLLTTAATLGAEGSIRGLTLKTIVGLLYCSGLRIGEALALNAEDLDAEQRTVFVRQGKFGKDRYVPLAESTIDALLAYLQKTENSRKDRALFVSTKGTRLAGVTIGNLFRMLVYQCGIASAAPWPRLHDLRHTYAVNCLCKWYEQGKDVNALLPVLSTAMGHVKVSCTQIYLHVPPQLRQQAASRFAQHVETRIIPERTS